jgi:hypothetical protein
MSKPSKEELIKYWTLQKCLDYCFEKCKFKDYCDVWDIDSASYRTELVPTCPYGNIRKAFNLLDKMTKDKPPAYFALNFRQYYGMCL